MGHTLKLPSLPLIDTVLGPWTESISFPNSYSIALSSRSLPTEDVRQG
jgi:hypothetical protein